MMLRFSCARYADALRHAAERYMPCFVTRHDTMLAFFRLFSLRHMPLLMLLFADAMLCRG